MVTFTPLISQEDDNETSWYSAAAAGIGSGLIKVPEGIVSLAAELIDLGADTDTAASVEKFFAKINPFDEKADEHAAGRLTEALVSIAIPGTIGFKMGKAAMHANALRMARKAIKARKAGNYGTISRKTALGAEQAQKLNKRARRNRFAAGIMGGAAGEVFVADVEDIGTFGDMFEDSPTAINHYDSEGREDASRKLLNRLKFGSESIFLTPFVYGVGKSAKLLATRGRDLAYSNSRFARILDKMSSMVRPRERLTSELFIDTRTFKGLEAGDAQRAKELFNNITKEVNSIFPELKSFYSKAMSKEKEIFMNQLNDLLLEGNLTKPLNKEKLGTLLDALKNKNVPELSRVKILEALNGARDEFANLVGIIEKGSVGKQVGKNIEELKNVMGDRLKKYIGTTYKIFEEKGVIGYKKYKPTDEAYRNLVSVVRRNLAENAGETINPKNNKYLMDSQQIVDEILLQVNKMKRAPGLPFKKFENSTLAGQTTRAFQQMVDLGGTINVLGKDIKIKDTDTKLFREFFGNFQDPRYTIFQGIGTLSSLARTTNYLQSLKNTNNLVQEKLGKQAGFFWESEAAAKAATNGVVDIVPANSLMNELTQNGAVANPFGNIWTTRSIAEGLGNAHNIQGKINGVGALIQPDPTNVAKNIATTLYRGMLLFPKGVSQIAKTVLSIPTHLRNYISAAAFSAANGIMFNPKLVKQGFDEALGGFGPRQLSGVFKFGERATPQMEKLYRELLELGVVNSQVQIGDLKNLFRDMGFGAKSFNIDSGLAPMMKKLKGLFGKFQGQYIAEDDFFKILNYAGEYGRIKSVYSTMAKKSKDFIMPDIKTIKQQAADIVRNTVPNYDYVGQYVKLARNLPIGNFMSFPSEMIRTSAGIARQVVKEMSHSKPTRGSNVLPMVYEIGKGLVKNDNPFYAVGFKRAAGMATTLTVLPTTMVEGAKALYDVSSDEIDALRQFVPEWSKNSTLVPLRGDDGELKYIDLSHSLAYDVVARPFRTLVTNIQEGQQDGENLLLSFEKGLIEAGGEIMNPFIDESIWTVAAWDLLFRKGKTRDGKILYTDQTSFSDKNLIRFKHLGEALMPSYKQFVRLTQAGLENPTKTGEYLDLPDQVMGIAGFRPMKVNPLKSMGFKIAEFQTGTRNARREFTGGYFGLLKGGPVDPNDIVERYIASNEARFHVQKEMFKNINAAGVLGTSDRDLRKVFKDRQISQATYRLLNKGYFDPYFPSADIIAKFREIARNTYDISSFISARPEVRAAEQQFKGLDLGTLPRFNQGGRVGLYGGGAPSITLDESNPVTLPDPLTEVLPVLKAIDDDLTNLNLAGEFELDINDYISEAPQTDVAAETPPLPQQPMPSAQVIQSAQQMGTEGSSGLTPMENALLTDEEKLIRLRGRGMTT